jgi:hypothetical protein
MMVPCMHTSGSKEVFLFTTLTRAEGRARAQEGIWLGLNGMAVGGKRRITIGPGRVYGGLLIKGTPNQRGDFVRKEKLLVEATLTASCIPVLLRPIKLPTSRYMIEREVWCSSSSEPLRSPDDPIWHLY